MDSASVLRFRIFGGESDTQRRARPRDTNGGKHPAEQHLQGATETSIM